ncbi:MAG: hypothetical protein KTR16_07930, partial [Acidiferrobacterales bacterium]|nr:hypothetical protein [Acidiferrobacterales bacterium]
EQQSLSEEAQINSANLNNASNSANSEKSSPAPQLSLLDMSKQQVADVIAQTDLDDLSPRQAWDLLNQLKQQIN